MNTQDKTKTLRMLEKLVSLAERSAGSDRTLLPSAISSALPVLVLASSLGLDISDYAKRLERCRYRVVRINEVYVPSNATIH